jgi:hypothetical protein
VGEKLSTFVSFGTLIALFCMLMAQVVQSYEDRATRGLPPSDDFVRMSRLIQQEQLPQGDAGREGECSDAAVQLAVQH